MRRLLPVLPAVLFACSVSVVLAQDQGHRPTNALQFRFGGFFPRGGGDIWRDDEQLFTLDSSDFNGGVFGFTYAMALDNRFELGFNIDFYEETVRSQVRSIPDQDGFPILHDTRFENIPMTVDFRFLPGGRYGVRGERRVLHPVPYIGAGLGANYWEYEEVGDFCTDALGLQCLYPQNPPYAVFSGRFIDTGVEFETHVLAGLELPINPQFTFLLESRYAWSEAKPSGDLAGYGTLDLGGWYGYVGFTYRF